jgi:signal transduction histidine kinase
MCDSVVKSIDITKLTAEERSAILTELEERQQHLQQRLDSIRSSVEKLRPR